MKLNKDKINIDCRVFYIILLFAYFVVLLFLIIIIEYYKEPLSKWMINTGVNDYEYNINF